MLDNTKMYFLGLLLIPLVISVRDGIQIYKINSFISIFTFLMGSLGIAQLLFPSVSDFFVIDMSEFGYNTGEGANVISRIIGISLRPSHYGNLMTLLLIYLIGVSKSISFPRVIFYIGLLVSILAIIFSGVKMSLASFIIGLIILAVLKKDMQLGKVIVIGLIATFVSWNIITEIGNNFNAEDGFSNSLGRSFQLFSIMKANGGDDVSTLSLTTVAFQNFSISPFLGSGDKMNWLKNLSTTDANLMYHLVQYGIIGMLLIFSPYLIFITRITDTSSRSIVLSLFFVILLQTLTDPGLFHIPTNLVFCLIIAINLNESTSDLSNGRSSKVS